MSLPADILFITCEQLRLSKDFDTLFQCSLVSKAFAATALPNLWRIHDSCSFSTTEETFDLDSWITLWRSLVLSSFPGATYAPYILWIRVLSLRDLDDLLHEKGFRTPGFHGFFNGELVKFAGPFKSLPRNFDPRGNRMEVAAQTAEAIVDHITEYCQDVTRSNGRNSLLEELDCRVVEPELLHRLIPRIPGLRSLRLWDGHALRTVAPTIRISCPKFESLTFYFWSLGPAVDDIFAEFLNELRPQSLKHLEIMSYSDSSELTAAALGRHNDSLHTLKLGQTRVDFLQALPMIGSCSRLNLLHMRPEGSTYAIAKEARKEIGNWISSCTSITELIITHQDMDFGPDILTPVLHSELRLVKLDLRYYTGGASTTAFHRALSSQAASLEYLTLYGAIEPQKDLLIGSISQLVKLQELHFRDVTDLFLNQDIILLISKLPLLQELAISGSDVDDEIWPAISTLRFLQRLDLNAYSTFTREGIFRYIESLGEGNHGLALSITMADPYSPLTLTEQEDVQDALALKADGRFEYILSRDLDALSDSESESD